MKKIFTTIIIACVICFNHFNAAAQCTAYISGNTCVTTGLTANYSGDEATYVWWYRDGVLQQIRGRRNPDAITVAGGGTTPESQLSGPQDVAVDSYGNIYVIDGNKYRVQKWMPGATSGITVAGGNGKGSDLNQFFSPQGIAVDNSGNVYVSDALMQRITKWAPGATQGAIVAGGNGTGNHADQLNGPQNIFLDGSGNLFIADRWNHRVQKWVAGAVAGTTVAGGNGGGSAANQLYEPLDVVADNAGNVYVIDYFNDRIQKWAPGATTGITVAGGNGKGGAANQFNFTTALSITDNGTLYVRDQGNYRVQQWKPGADAGITIAGGVGPGSGANKVGPGFGLFADENSNVYVPELFDNIVKSFLPAATADMKYTALVPGSYFARVRAKECIAKSDVFLVLGVPEKPARIFGPATVSEGQTGIVYRLDSVKGSSYQWSVPGDATIVKGQGTKSIRVNWGSSGGQVTVIAINACGVSKMKRRDVTVIPGALAVAEKFPGNKASISIYPNPVINKANVVFSSSKCIGYTFTLTNITGKVLFTKRGITSKGENKAAIPVERLKPGNYFIHLKDDEYGSRSAGFIRE